MASCSTRRAWRMTDRVVPDSGLRAGDRLIVTGTLGDHGMAVMAGDTGWRSTAICDRTSPRLNGLMRAALASAPGRIVAMKDPTRGGLASALHEMAEKSHVGIIIDEMALPVTPAGAGGGGAARHRPAACRQRREGGARRAARGGRRRCSRRCARIRWAATRPSLERAPGTASAPSFSTRASDAGW